MNRRKKKILAALGCAACTAAFALMIFAAVKPAGNDKKNVSSADAESGQKITTESGDTLVDEDAFPDDADIIVADYAKGGSPSGITVIKEEHVRTERSDVPSPEADISVPGSEKGGGETRVTESPSGDLGRKQPEYVPPSGGDNPFEDGEETETGTFDASELGTDEGCGEGIHF